MSIRDTIPVIKAAQVQANLENIARLGSANAEKILGLVRESTVRQIKDATRVAWLPLELDVELTESVKMIVGENGLFDWSKKCLMASFKTGLLGPLIAGSIQVFGVSPKTMFKLAPRAWNTIFRNCGQLSLEDKGKTELHMVGSDLAFNMLDSSAYLAGISGSMASVFEVTRTRGQVKEEVGSIQDKRVVWVASWR